MRLTLTTYDAIDSCSYDGILEQRVSHQLLQCTPSCAHTTTIAPRRARTPPIGHGGAGQR